MKNTLKLMMLAVLAFGMMACGGKEQKLTQDDLKAAEKTLFNENRTLNEEVAPEVAEKYCLFVKQNPNDSTSAKWLFHAMEINVMLKNADKSIELCNQLNEDYPDSEWTPRALLYVGSFVYNDQLNDTAQAHATLHDAQKSIEYLGLSPDEIMARIMMSQMEEMGMELDD